MNFSFAYIWNKATFQIAIHQTITNLSFGRFPIQCSWIVGRMQEGRKCIHFLHFAGKIFLLKFSLFFFFFFFLTFYFFHKNVNTLSWDLQYSLKCVNLPVLSMYVKETQFHPKYHLRLSCIQMTNHSLFKTIKQ